MRNRLKTKLKGRSQGKKMNCKIFYHLEKLMWVRLVKYSILESSKEVKLEDSLRLPPHNGQTMVVGVTKLI